MRIIGVEEIEIGTTIRQELDLRGVSVTLLDEGAFDAWVFSPDYHLWSYVRPSRGDVVYLLEVRIFVPPDMEVIRSYVLDARPSRDQMALIARDNLPLGSIVPETSGGRP